MPPLELLGVQLPKVEFAAILAGKSRCSMPGLQEKSRILLSARHDQHGYEAVPLFRDYESKTCMVRLLILSASRNLIFVLAAAYFTVDFIQ